ncbi:class F sortase [Citricoccus alkalitolerans]|uniref:Class F sortase n=1 Tax=Citricoccus alkalitolerans TaxID=246603 RepID=A0ABV8Y2B5_9MICC
MVAGLAAAGGMLCLAAGLHVLTQQPAVVAQPFGATTTARLPVTAETVAPLPRAHNGPIESAADGEHTTGESDAVTARVPVPPGQASFADTGVVADVVPVGVLPSGALQIPEDPARIGWWAAGALPGQSEGTMVLAGHMDGLHQNSAMSVLLEVEAGDTVVIEDHRGGFHQYRVSSRSTAPRDSLDPALFATDGPHRLVLLTCGGTYDEQTGQYTDNIVVVAEPVTEDDS